MDVKQKTKLLLEKKNEGTKINQDEAPSEVLKSSFLL